MIFIINILMNNLASLKSELLQQYTEQLPAYSKSKHFYQHHNLPIRTHLKSSQAKTKPITTKLNFEITTEKSTYSRLQNQPSRIIGRNLFSNPQIQKVPGPGSYQSPLRRYASSCYIKKEENHLLMKVQRRLRRRQIINECRGPGLYHHEKAFSHTSRSLSIKQGKIFAGNFTRTIVPQRKTSSIYLASTLSQQDIMSKKLPAPNSYDIQRLGFKTSNFFNPTTHKISMTQRSNIAKEDSLPGPGFYQWSKIYQRKKLDDKKKPSIQYKFIYGHPS